MFQLSWKHLSEEDTEEEDVSSSMGTWRIMRDEVTKDRAKATKDDGDPTLHQAAFLLAATL